MKRKPRPISSPMLVTRTLVNTNMELKERAAVNAFVICALVFVVGSLGAVTYKTLVEQPTTTCYVNYRISPVEVHQYTGVYK